VVDNDVSAPPEDIRLSPAEQRPKPEPMDQKRVVGIISLQLFGFAVLLVLGEMYTWFHSVPGPFDFLRGKTITTYLTEIQAFNFVGVDSDTLTPSLYAVMLEVGIWSFAGVIARGEFYLTQILILRRTFKPLEFIGQLIGESAMGIAIAMAVVAFLRSTEFANLSLGSADIGGVAAIAFILGFYHEDTRRLLGSFRSRISGKDEESEDTGDTS
jgi:hypothetical protein